MPKWNLQNTQTKVANYSDDPTVVRWVRLYRLRIAVVVVLSGAALVFGVRPAYAKFREYQVNRNLEAAKVASRAEDWGLARDRARSVLLARPGDFEAIRIWFKALAAMNEPRTYMVAIQLFVDPRSTWADRLEAFRVMVDQAPQAITLGAFGSFTDEQRGLTEVRTAIAPLMIERGEFGMAEQMLRSAPEIETDAPARLALLKVLCASPTVERVAEAREIFAGLIQQGASEEALEALRVLGETPGGLAAGEPLPNLRDWVEAQPNTTTLHRLLAQHPLIDALGDSADSVFSSVIPRFIKVDPAVLGNWLLRHDRNEEVVRLMEEPAKTDGAAYISYLHALLRVKDPAAISQALANPPKAVDLVDLELAKAAAARMQQDRAVENKAWNEALRLAAFDVSHNRFIEIGRYAGLLGASQVVQDSWLAAVLIGWGRLPLYRDLQPVFGALASQGKSADLLAMYRSLIRFEPQNPELVNNYQYLALLHGVVAPAASVKSLEELCASYPDRPEFRSALALAFLMNQQPAQAMEQLPKLAGSDRISPIMLQAIEGCARVIMGETEAGKAKLAGVNWRLFLKVEALAFRRLLTALSVKDLPMPELETEQATENPEEVPAWRAAVERMERQRANDTLPALPAPKMPDFSERANEAE